MSSHRFGGTDRNLFAKQISDGVSLKRIPNRRRSPMSIDVTDNAGVKFRVPQRIPHNPKTAFMLRRRLRHMKGVGRHAIPDNLSQDWRTATTSIVQLFQHQNSSAFAHNEPVAILIPRTTGA